MRINDRIVALALASAVAFGVLACSRSSGPGGAAVKVAKYHCAMHPQYTSDKPGDCPICGMRLVPIEQGGARRILYYRNPMNPGITSPAPMKDEMGMDYVPVYEGDVSTSAVAGQAPVKLSSESEQEIGVTVSTVQVRNLETAIKAPSRVAYDPNLYSAILEYQEARRNARGDSEERTEAADTVRASRLRLRQMGLSDDQIRQIDEPGFDPSNLLLGKRGGNVWVYIDIYDYEAGFVKPGQRVEFTSPAFPGETFWGTVRAIDSILNSETRTLRVRAEVPNPKGELKPELYLSATIHADLGRKLAIPESAVLDTGVRQLVYVRTAPGHYEPRVVRVGREASGYFEVVSGLTAGETVVTSANFLIDSESKIRAAAQGAK